MANWKKVIVSGSRAELLDVTASFKGDGSGLTGITATSLDIDNFGTDLTSATLSTSDLILVSDAGDDGRANIGDLATPLAGTNLEESSGTIRIATSAAGSGLGGGGGSALSVNVDDTGIEINSDSLRLKDDGVTYAKIQNVAANNVLLGNDNGAGSAVQELSKSDVLTLLNVEDGADVTDAAAVLGAIPVIVSQSEQVSGSIYGGVSGDVTITAAGVASIAANSVALGTDTTGNYVASLTAGALIDLQNNTGETATPTIDVDLTEATEASIADGDYIVFLDGGATGTHAKESIADVATLFAGNGLTATNSVIAVDYGTGANTAAQGNTSVTFNGTANEIELSTNNFTTIGGGGTVTIGLPNDVTIGNDLTVTNDAVITGNLTVNGDYITANVTNLAVDDKFILLNSGSASGDSGIIFGGAGGNANEGYAIFFDDDATLFGFSGVIDGESTGTAANSKLGNIESAAGAPSSAPTLQGIGTIHINTSLTATNDNNIWIYS